MNTVRNLTGILKMFNLCQQLFFMYSLFALRK